ncbi:hypothetical protein EV702DRAFT_1044952 [Suillus placidus]|uniref:Uncharacterized protein n=1 Tax=Suillus placidus TaxID=48579 RepID=A0A9P6ZY31_9AGAM|nr:hypothetical protein EV702DRAFT_1044952 [Suillus placidus]
MSLTGAVVIRASGHQQTGEPPYSIFFTEGSGCATGKYVCERLLTWIPPHAVSNAILDVALAEEEPPIVVNLIHPRPIAWGGQLCGLLRTPQPSIRSLVPFFLWLEKFESSAKDARVKNIKRIPAIKLLDFMRSVTRSDITIRASSEMLSEAGTLLHSPRMWLSASVRQSRSWSRYRRQMQYSGWTIGRRWGYSDE